MWSISLVVTLFVCWQCFIRKATASYGMKHPQRTFCDADYVFRFRPISEPKQSESAPSINRVGRTKRLVPGGFGMPKRQTVEVQRFYKGAKMAKSVMKLGPRENPVDVFTNERKIEATIRLGMYQKPLKKGKGYIFFGRMFRYRNNTIKPSSQQIMMANLVNTMAESSVTKLMRRGFRKKYAQGCRSGCKVMTVYRADTTKSKSFCYWNVNKYPAHNTDCCKTTQFCYRGKNGYCQWKRTKAYRKCVAENRWP